MVSPSLLISSGTPLSLNQGLGVRLYGLSSFWARRFRVCAFHTQIFRFRLTNGVNEGFLNDILSPES